MGDSRNGIAGMGPHLAAELGVSLAVLQGSAPPPSPCAVEMLQKHLQDLPPIERSPEVVARLAQLKGDPNPLEGVAEEIAARLEAAHLVQDFKEFAALSALTGLSEVQLRAPASYKGLWMVVESNRKGSEVYPGLSYALQLVEERVDEILQNWPGSDAKIVLKEEQPWFLLEVVHPWQPAFNRTFRLVRCQPDEKGLKWVAPTWEDRLILNCHIDSLYGRVNFVTSLNGHAIPQDATALRFAIMTSLPLSSASSSAEPAPQMIGGERVVLLHGVAPLGAARRRFEQEMLKEGHGHGAVLERLSEGLWDTLEVLINRWPLDWWSVKCGSGSISLFSNPPESAYRGLTLSKQAPPAGGLLTVFLVEELANKELRPVPWSSQSMSALAKRFESSLAEARESYLAVMGQQGPWSKAAT